MSALEEERPRRVLRYFDADLTPRSRLTAVVEPAPASPLSLVEEEPPAASSVPPAPAPVEEQAPPSLTDEQRAHLAEGGAVLLQGDALQLLRGLADASVDAVVTDPPYGLSKEPDPIEVLRHWLAGDDYRHRGGGFMGKTWDSFVPGPSVWRECHRVLRPGGHLLAFAGARTQDLMGISIRLAGFEVRDSITWIYGSGFPKSRDISKDMDKAAGIEREDKFEGVFDRRSGPTGNKKCDSCGKWLVSGSPCQCPRPQDDPQTDDAKRWQGWGTALKPASEPIVVARKPLSGTVAANVLAHGTGALNVDGCRVHMSNEDRDRLTDWHQKYGGKDYAESGIASGKGLGHVQPPHSAGRWPANVVLTHSADCEQVGTREVRSDGHHPAARGRGGLSTTGHGGQNDLEERKSGSEVVAAWRCAEGCPVAEMDRQSGDRKASGIYDGDGSRRPGDHATSFAGGHRPTTMYADTGGASRFFPTFEWSAEDELDRATFKYQAKAAQRERAAGLDGRNPHPTVKPVELMRWLVRLVTPPGGVVLDPFTGSGTTGIACAREGLAFLGVEREAEYVEVARRRVEHAGGRL